MLVVSRPGHKDSPSALIKSYFFICNSDMRAYYVTIQIFLKNICFPDLPTEIKKKTTNALENQIKLNFIIAD